MEAEPEERGTKAGCRPPQRYAEHVTRDVKTLAAEQGEDSVAALVWLPSGGHAKSEQVRLGATTAILDRAYGRPRQEVDVSSEEQTVIIVNRNRGCSPVAQVVNPPAIEDGRNRTEPGCRAYPLLIPFRFQRMPLTST